MYHKPALLLKSNLGAKKLAYFFSDVKNLFKSRIIKITLIIMVIVVIADPIIEKILMEVFNYSNKAFHHNAYAVWLLNPVSLVGHTLFFCLFTVFPVIFTGLDFFGEYSTSIYPFKIMKVSRKKYLSSKILSVFSVSFISSFAILSLNLISCFAVFSFSSSQSTINQFSDYVPIEGSFAHYFYHMNPLFMAIVYNLITALAISLLSVFALSLQMTAKFKNPFLAFFIPTLTLFFINFVSDVTLLPQYNIFQIIQPAHTCLATSPYMTSISVTATYAFYFIAVLACTLLGVKRNDDFI